jgi:hypothetical protein
VRAGVVLVAAALAASPALAQQPGPQPSGTTCDVQIDSTGGTSRILMSTGGQYDTFAGGGIWAHCRGQPTSMYADSVAWYPERDLLYLTGHVRFRDSVSVLNADSVTYLLRQERLLARGHVYTQNLRTRSDLNGPNLDYRRAAPQIRDTLESYATGRPTMHFYPSRRAGAPPPAATDTEPFVVVADRTHMRGNDRMWAGGRVTVDRSDLAARGDSAELDLARNRGALLGSPKIDGAGADAYHLVGRYISFRLSDEHEIREVVSSGDAVARGPDWRLDADTLDMSLDSGKVQRARAWGRTKRPTAVSGVHTIVADSLDIHMPGQVVRLVWGYGRARTASRDSLSSDEDWMTGDTMRADFAARAATQDSAARRKAELEHLTAFGSARALYHVENDRHPRGPKGVDYSRGERIDIAMDSSRVRTVNVVGEAQGVYLEPLPPEGDTSGATPDSSRTAPADTAPGARAPADTTRRVPADGARRSPADTTRRVTPETTRRAPADPARPRPERP